MIFEGLSLLLFFACAAAYTIWPTNGAINFFSAIIGGAALTIFCQLCFKHSDYLKHFLRLCLIRLKSLPLRISFASLIRIKIDDKYVLIKSRRFNDLWQPVGGVYKFFDPNIRHTFGLQDDNGLFKKSDPNELRLSFPPNKINRVFDFMKWFDSRLGREISPDREFREELLDQGILDKEVFKEVHFQFIERHFHLGLSDKFKLWELMAFEIFELRLSDSQKNQIKDRLQTNNKDVILLTKNEIDHNGFTREGDDYRIGGQTKYIL